MASEKDLRQAEYFRNRVAKNEKALRRWARREGVEALRLYDRDIPEVPLAADRYGDSLLLSLYERPYEKAPEAEAEWLALMGSAAAEELGLDPAKVFAKTRRRQRGEAQYEKLGDRKSELVVREGGLSFVVNLSDYLDTGLFLDHRPTRAMVREASRERSVLNLFAYTGSFTVYAASGGASSSVSVDLSNTYLSWARRNLELNGFGGEAHALVREDAMAFLARSAADGRRWDLIVADPPTYSNSKMARGDFDVNRDWPALVGACLQVLSPGGRLFFSTNSRGLKWEAERCPAAHEDITAATIPPDFRDPKIHRCWLISG